MFTALEGSQFYFIFNTLRDIRNFNYPASNVIVLYTAENAMANQLFCSVFNTVNCSVFSR